MTILDAAINLTLAVFCGALIGSERQIKQRMAGLRTNALVALGAAAFVIFSLQFEHEVSQTRVAAQVVSGIGFLGAGIIFRDGFNVHGLNTAATLWCSAAVGLLAGSGAWTLTFLVTFFVAFVNIGLRPIVNWIKHRTKAGIPMLRQFAIQVTCDKPNEGEARSLILRSMSMVGLKVSELRMVSQDGEGHVDLAATVSGESVPDSLVEGAIATLAADPRFISVSWQTIEEA